MTHGDDQHSTQLTDFSEVGQALRRRREELGLSIDEVMQHTKLGRRTLELLEQGDLRELPHPVYIKGFIKAYIAVLNVDMETFLPGLDGVLDTGADEEQPVKVKVSRTLPDVGATGIKLPSANRLKSIGIVLLLILLAAGGFIWYSLSEETPSSENATLLPTNNGSSQMSTLQETPSTAESAQEALLRNNATLALDPIPVGAGGENATGEAQGESTRPSGTAAPIREEAPNAAAPQGSNNETNASPLDAISSTNALGEGGGSPAVELVSPLGDRQTLVLRASEQCWVGLTLDNEAANDFYLYPNQFAVVKFRDTVALRLGNAGAVSFDFNGEPYPTNFSKGEVQTIIFPPGN